MLGDVGDPEYAWPTDPLRFLHHEFRLDSGDIQGGHGHLASSDRVSGAPPAVNSSGWQAAGTRDMRPLDC